MTDDFKLIDIVRKLNGEKPEREPQEDYQLPYRIKFLKGKIMLFQSQMDDLVEDRRQAIKELKKFNSRAITHSTQLRDRLAHTEARLRETEAKLKETYQLLREEMKHL